MPVTPAVILFSLASLLPSLCLLAGSFLGGIWPFTALMSISMLVIAMDRSGLSIEPHVTFSNWLPRAVAVAHFVTLAATVWAAGSATLEVGDKVLLVIAMGLYSGQVSNACAHELIHRSDRLSRSLGTTIYCSIMNGQHVSAHLLVHHPHAGTEKDLNSAPLGRSFYHFALTAASAELIGGWRAENTRRARQGKGVHSYWIYVSGAAISLILAAMLGSNSGVFALVAVSAHAQIQLMMSDYVQHYGLRRRLERNGKPEPMKPHHSWNAPYAYSAAMMLNAPRHSDHHMAPARPFPDLQLDTRTMPTLPYALPTMGAIALVPPLWRRIMDERVQNWSTRLQHQSDRKEAEFSPSVLAK